MFLLGEIVRLAERKMIDKFLKALLLVLEVGTNFWVRNIVLVALFSATAYLAWPYMQGKELWVQAPVALVLAFMIILSYSAVVYFLLSLVDSAVNFFPTGKFSAGVSFERAKAKLVKGLVEKEFKFSLNPVDQYSPGLDQGVFAVWRKQLLSSKPPFVAISKNPFIVVKIVEKKTRLERIRKAVDNREEVEISAVVDEEDSASLSFLRYLETSLKGPGTQTD